MARTIIHTPYPSAQRVARLLKLTPQRIRRIEEIVRGFRTGEQAAPAANGKSSGVTALPKTGARHSTPKAGRIGLIQTPDKAVARPKK